MTDESDVVAPLQAAEAANEVEWVKLAPQSGDLVRIADWMDGRELVGRLHLIGTWVNEPHPVNNWQVLSDDGAVSTGFHLERCEVGVVRQPRAQGYQIMWRRSAERAEKLERWLADRPTRWAYEAACEALEKRRVALVNALGLPENGGFYDAVEHARRLAEGAPQDAAQPPTSEASPQ